jgi:hypothetical protein
VSTHASGAGDLKWYVSRTCDTGACIKVTRKGEIVLIGSTTEPDGPFGEFTVDEFRHFLAGAKNGDFDGIS